MDTINRVHAKFRKDGYHIIYRIPYNETKNVMDWLKSLGAFSEIWSDKEVKNDRKL